MAAYSTMNTIPAKAVEAETPLLQREVKINAKTLVGGAAVAAFALGALGATAVSSPAAPAAPAAMYSAPRAPAAFYASSSWTNIELGSDTSKCLAGSGSGQPLSVVDCAPHTGVFQQINADGGITFQSQGLCVTALRDDSPEFEAGQPFGLFTCSDNYAAWQQFTVAEAGTGQTYLNLANTNLCMTVEGDKVVAAECEGKRDQNLKLAQSTPVTTKPPTPRPAPRPSHHKYPNGHSCNKDSDCKSGDCHHGSGKYHNTCKDPSPVPSPTKKPTSSPPYGCGKKCSKDSDCAIGGFLQYPTCYVSAGTRCEGFCGP